MFIHSFFFRLGALINQGSPRAKKSVHTYFFVVIYVMLFYFLANYSFRLERKHFVCCNSNYYAFYAENCCITFMYTTEHTVIMM